MSCSALKSSARRQRGAALILVMIGLLALLGMAGLALDIGHLTLNKARLQSVVDAAALAAAKTLYDGGSTAAATAAATNMANSVFALNAAAIPELSSAMGNGLNVTVQYSTTLNPFSAGTNPPNFVRVEAQNFTMAATLARAVGVVTLSTAASAVAGPQGINTGNGSTVCNVVPMMMCGSPAAGAPMWGYTPNQLIKLKRGSASSSTVGPGNYYLIRLGGDGANIVRENLAGAFEGCITMGGSAEVETQPGNVAGPTRQGLNTRFNEYQGGMNRSEYPPDVITTEPNPTLEACGPNNDSICTQGSAQPITSAGQISFNHAGYSTRLPNGTYDVQPAPTGDGVFRRREVAVPIANCSGTANGQSNLPVLGFACVFLLQRVQGTGQNADIYGQIIGTCNSGGSPGPPGGGVSPSSPVRIVLYDDPGSADS
jgi:Flp pilus assembly protein TadG